MKPIAKRHIKKEEAHSLTDNHKCGREQVIINHGSKENNHIDTHKCILWSDWKEETDKDGNKSPNRYVVDEFTWEERTPDWLLKSFHRFR